MEDRAYVLADWIMKNDVYGVVPALREAFWYRDQFTCFCETRKCPACPFWPCHGDAPPYVIMGPEGLTYRRAS